MSEAHVTGGRTVIVSDYLIQFATYPTLPTPMTNTTLIFSIQNTNSTDKGNITASVLISKDGREIKIFPKQLYIYGDFGLQHVFNDTGTYQITLMIYGSEPSTPVTAGFEVNVYDEFSLFIMRYGFTAILAIVAAGLTVLGLFNFRRRRENETAEIEADQILAQGTRQKESLTPSSTQSPWNLRRKPMPWASLNALSSWKCLKGCRQETIKAMKTISRLRRLGLATLSCVEDLELASGIRSMIGNAGVAVDGNPCRKLGEECMI